MELSEKILTLRRARGLSQEALAEKLQVSRQAVSRWENGTALPDASNILQLSKLFGVSADYLLNNDWEENAPMPETEPPAPKKSPIPEKTKPCRWSGTRIAGICMAAIGFCTNLVIYIASRMVEVVVPYTTVDADGTKWYHWDGAVRGHSYQYLIQEYDLELLAGVGWCLLVVGLGAVIWGQGGVRAMFCRWQRWIEEE